MSSVDINYSKSFVENNSVDPMVLVNQIAQGINDRTAQIYQSLQEPRETDLNSVQGLDVKLMVKKQHGVACNIFIAMFTNLIMMDPKVSKQDALLKISEQINQAKSVQQAFSLKTHSQELFDELMDQLNIDITVKKVWRLGKVCLGRTVSDLLSLKQGVYLLTNKVKHQEKTCAVITTGEDLYLYEPKVGLVMTDAKLGKAEMKLTIALYLESLWRNSAGEKANASLHSGKSRKITLSQCYYLQTS